MALVVRGPGGVDLHDVRSGPSHEAADVLAQRRAERRERIPDARRDLRKDRAHNHAVAFQPAQRDGEHSLADAVDLLSDLAEAERLRRTEHMDHVYGPGIPDAGEDVACMAVRWRVLQLSWPCQ